MARTQKKKEPPYADLPVLTERPEEEIPVLMETLADEIPKPAQKSPAILTEEQYRELTTQIASQLEAMLREKFASHIDALWQQSWQEVEKDLPELIRSRIASLK